MKNLLQNIKYGFFLTSLLVLPFCLSANEMLEKETMKEGQWPIYGGNYGNQRHSPLKEINTDNVKNLKPAYIFNLGTLGPQYSTPLVIGDTLYVTASGGPKYVYAVEAVTGRTKWIYEPKVAKDAALYDCCGGSHRGVAYGNGHIFVGLTDGRVVALNAQTGKESWIATVSNYKLGSVINSPPLVVKDKLVVGHTGGEFGTRGYLTGLDINTGKEVWRTYTVPGPGEPGNETWEGDSWKRGGGVMWYVGSYDPKLDLIYWGTSNAAPWAASPRGPDTSDFGQFTNLYTASTIAFNPDNGKMVWHYQTTPHDAWDYDDANEKIFAELKINGKMTPVLATANKNGFFYVINRKTGQLISADPFVQVNWAKGIDMATGRPIEVPGKRAISGKTITEICPSFLGGKSWQPASYSPDSGLFFINANNLCMDLGMAKKEDIKHTPGKLYLGTAAFKVVAGLKQVVPGTLGSVMAWDPVKRKPVWENPEKTTAVSGTLNTSGGLVFYGNGSGDVKAVNAKNGNLLWKFNVGTAIGMGPISYSVNGKQYITVVAGKSKVLAAFLGEPGKFTTEQSNEGGVMVTFTL